MTWKIYKARMEGTIINMLFLVFPNLLKMTLQMFACTSIENNLYLDIYMEDECWIGDHFTYTLSVAVPATIVWGIGLPFASFFKIIKLNSIRKLRSRKNRKVYGFLYDGYTIKKYWWEMVILARKVIVLFALIWLNQTSV